jgi:dihydrolipoamide dehydrogenase
VAAIKGAQKGLKTICIEKRGSLGGTCLNVGCIPSKALLNATHKLHEAQHDLKGLGVNIKEVSMDYPVLMKYKDKVVGGLTGGIEHLFKKNKVDYVKGWGKFSSANEITVDLNDGGTQIVKAKNTVIATGSEPCPLHGDIIKTDGVYVINSDHAFSIAKVPKKMVVVGAGVIGLELGSVF